MAETLNIQPLTDEDMRELMGARSPAEVQTDIRTTQPTQLDKTPQQLYQEMGIEEKIYRGMQLTPEEQRIFETYGNPVTQGLQKTTETTGKLGVYHLSTTLPEGAKIAAGTVIGGGATLAGGFISQGAARLLGGEQIAQGVARFAGLVGGAATGSEINQALGLESDSNWNTGIAALTAGAGLFLDRVGKTVARGSTAARIIRGVRSREIINEMPINAVREQVERTLGQRLPYLTTRRLDMLEDMAWNDVRQSSERINLPQFTQQIWNMPTETAQMIYNGLRRSDMLLADRFALNTPGVRIRPVPLQGRYYGAGTWSGQELDMMHKWLTNERDALMRSTGAGRATNLVHAHRIDDVIKALDSSIEMHANAFRAAQASGQTIMPGGKLAHDYQRATQLSHINFAQDGLADQLQRLKKFVRLRKMHGTEIDLSRLEDQFDNARRLMRRGRPHPLSSMIRLLDDQPGGYAAFRRDLQELKQLAPDNNVQFFGNTFGVLTRTAAIAAEIGPINAFAELMMSPIGRKLLIHFAEVNGPVLTPPFASVLLSTTRAALATDLADQEINILKSVYDLGVALNGQLAPLDTPSSMQLGPRDVIDPKTGRPLPPALQAPPNTQRRRPAPESLPPGQRGMASPSFMPF